LHFVTLQEEYIGIPEQLPMVPIPIPMAVPAQTSTLLVSSDDPIVPPLKEPSTLSQLLAELSLPSLVRSHILLMAAYQVSTATEHSTSNRISCQKSQALEQNAQMTSSSRQFQGRHHGSHLLTCRRWMSFWGQFPR